MAKIHLRVSTEYTRGDEGGFRVGQIEFVGSVEFVGFLELANLVGSGQPAVGPTIPEPRGLCELHELNEPKLIIHELRAACEKRLEFGSPTSKPNILVSWQRKTAD
ncbi:MAG: hypothetical protein NTX23_05395 [Candidatus Bipolaricaulota bacterium]|nr:hypothetical protein [Candidatus Bipolaricaulota bacterium]